MRWESPDKASKVRTDVGRTLEAYQIGRCTPRDTQLQAVTLLFQTVVTELREPDGARPD